MGKNLGDSRLDKIKIAVELLRSMDNLMTSWIHEGYITPKGHIPMVMGSPENGILGNAGIDWRRLLVVQGPCIQRHGTLLLEALWSLKQFTILWCFPSSLDVPSSPSYRRTPFAEFLGAIQAEAHMGGGRWSWSLSEHPANALIFLSSSPKHDQNLSHSICFLRFLNLGKSAFSIINWEWPELCTHP